MRKSPTASTASSLISFQVLPQVLCQIRQHSLAGRGRVHFRLVKSGDEDALAAQDESTATHCL